jgi:ketosteroid isomerase-like protein
MSEENVEIVRRGYQALKGGDISAWLGGFDPEVVLHENASFPDVLTFRGHAGLLKWVESVNEIWDDPAFDPKTFRSAGDFVMVSGQATGRGRGSGAPFDEPLYHVFRFRNGKVIELWGYSDQAQALEAAGLSE